MELSREAYQLIIRNVSSRSDLCSLARVSKSFQNAAERALYNTLFMDDPELTVELCDTLSAGDLRATFVDALTIFVTSSADRDDEDQQSNGLPGEYWNRLAAALRRMTRLRFFNLHIDHNPSYAWILSGCIFKLHSFHCDLAWDANLVKFLNTQDKLRDLYLADYASTTPPTSQPEGETVLPVIPPATVTLHPDSLRALSTIECSFIDAISALVPGRPVVRVKTCFSREDALEKTAELLNLGTSLRRSSMRVCSLDLADGSYTEDFSLTMLNEVARRLPELRYLGTLVLPVGLERLQFFGLLMRLRRLCAIELEVSEWVPAPTPQAMRALASELRLYCPSVKCMVFVREFERTTVRVVNGFCAVEPDPGTSTDNLWRDV
ncbi:hypothetical protein DFH11DRAFT_1516667 [Phellopilus nigrolimitatus]|nr:hypothetical protein DFH11DRAFT_1518290 [Phellopilus nigrolimitatus]KAH8108579.1 hypothetical protein DFH11DRAFT_1516667 [Phellopilus nigrolimitatus]